MRRTGIQWPRGYYAQRLRVPHLRRRSLFSSASYFSLCYFRQVCCCCAAAADNKRVQPAAATAALTFCAHPREVYKCVSIYI